MRQIFPHTHFSDLSWSREYRLNRAGKMTTLQYLSRSTIPRTGEGQLVAVVVVSLKFLSSSDCFPSCFPCARV